MTTVIILKPPPLFLEKEPEPLWVRLPPHLSPLVRPPMRKDGSVFPSVKHGFHENKISQYLKFSSDLMVGKALKKQESFSLLLYTTDYRCLQSLSEKKYITTMHKIWGRAVHPIVFKRDILYHVAKTKNRSWAYFMWMYLAVTPFQFHSEEDCALTTDLLSKLDWVVLLVCIKNECNSIYCRKIKVLSVVTHLLFCMNWWLFPFCVNFSSSKLPCQHPSVTQALGLTQKRHKRPSFCVS